MADKQSLEDIFSDQPPQQKQSLEDIFADHQAQQSQPEPAPVEQPPAMQRFKEGFTRGYKQNAVGLDQLANDVGVGHALGVPDQESLNGLAQQFEQEGKGTGIAGTMGELAGSPLNLIPMGGEAIQGVKQGLGAMAKMGAKYGAASGATAPSENDKGLLDRAENTGISTAAGAVLGPTLGKAAELPGKAAGAIINRFAPKVAMNKAQQQIVDELMKRPDAQEIINKAKANFSASNRSGVPITLAEALEDEFLMTKTGQLAINPETSGQASSFFDQRTKKQVGDALDKLGQNIGKWNDIDEAADTVNGAAKDAIKKINANLSSKSKPFYDLAYSHPVPTDDFYIKETLNKPSVQNSIKSVEQTAAERHMPLTDLFAEIKNPSPKMVTKKIQSGVDMYGNPTYQEIQTAVDPTIRVPTVRGWDMIKQDLDSEVSALYNSTNAAERKKARIVQETRDNLRAGLRNDIPGYRSALDTYAHNAQEDLPKIQNYLKDMASDKKTSDQVINKPFSGTANYTQEVAGQIGPDASKAAAKGKLMQAVEGNRGATDLSVPTKLGWNAERTQGQFNALLGPHLGGQFDDAMNTIQLAARGTWKQPFVGSQTDVRSAAGKAINNIKGAAKLATTNPLPWLDKMADIMNGQSSDAYKKGLANVMFTDEGQKLLGRVSNSKSLMQKRSSLKSLNEYVGKQIGSLAAIGFGQQAQ